jgi:cytochrome P450
MITPPALEMYRRFPLLFQNAPEYFRGLARDYGDWVHLRFGRSDFYLVSDPATIQSALVDHGTQFEKFPRVNPALGVFGDGLLTSEEPRHRCQRRIMQPAFHALRIEQYERAMFDCTRELVSRWRSGDVVDVGAEMNALTLEIICRTMFGASSREYAERVAELLEVIIPSLNRLVLPHGPLLLALPLPATRRYFRAVKELDRILEDLIEDRRRSGSAGDDLLGMMLEMPTRELRDEVVTIFIAGHETTANALVWTWYLLARNPSYEDEAADMASAERIVKEAMRLYPPVWILGRRALEAVELGPISLQQGDVMLVCMYALHRRKAAFPQAEAFRPERWDTALQHRFAYLPFGAGTRVCIGERFAWRETAIIVSEIARRFRLRFAGSDPVQPVGMLTLRPNGPVRMRLEARA